MWLNRAAMLGVQLAVIATLTGCGNSTTGRIINDGPNGLEVTGNAEGWKGGNAFIRATATNRDLNAYISQGSLAANGDFTITLPETPSLPATFGPLTCDATEMGKLRSTPSSLKVVLVRSFGVTETINLDDDELGEVVYAKGDLLGSGGATIGPYAFASAAGTVRGTCKSKDQVSTYTFDLSLEPGWNQVTTVFEDPGTDHLVTTFRTGKLPTDLRWLYSAYPPPPR